MSQILSLSRGWLSRRLEETKLFSVLPIVAAVLAATGLVALLFLMIFIRGH